MKRIFSKSVGPTGTWQPIAAKTTSMRLITITAIGGTVGIRDASDTADPGQITDGTQVSLVDVDLANIELNVPAEASASVIG